jgi:hypothetical protein
MPSLHVVIHHQRDPNRLWSNSWLSDDLIETITTTVEIGEWCREAMETGDRVLVHRCGYGDFDPCVCCSARVVNVDDVDRHTRLVRFTGQQTLNEPPPVQPQPGQNSYWA